MLSFAIGFVVGVAAVGVFAYFHIQANKKKWESTLDAYKQKAQGEIDALALKISKKIYSKVK